MSKKRQLGEGIGLTPPMGWNSFNTFGCEPTEQLIMESVDAIVASGLKDAGYLYVNIDDGWMADERDKDGNLIPDPKKFPNGMKVVTDYIHSNGLKAGTYLGCGQKTYGDKPGSLGYEERDAQLIASQGFDLLKYDYRELPGDPEDRVVKTDYITMQDALIKAGRPMFFSICEHGKSDPWTWGAEVGHMWRTTPDIKDSFDVDINWGWSLLRIIDHSHQYYSHGQPSGWNDPDMLVVGLNGVNEWMGPGCSKEEYQAHFSLWCLSAAPLLIGCDIRSMDESTKGILMNKEMIKVNQDTAGVQGRIIKKDNDIDYWLKPLSVGELALGILNRSTEPKKASIELTELGFNDKVEAKDLWNDREIKVYDNLIETSVSSHQCIVLKLSKNIK